MKYQSKTQRYEAKRKKERAIMKRLNSQDGKNRKEAIRRRVLRNEEAAKKRKKYRLLQRKQERR